SETAGLNRASRLRQVWSDVDSGPVHEEASMSVRVRRIRDLVCGGAVLAVLSAAPVFAQDPAPAPAPPPAQQQQTFAPLPPEPEGFTLAPFLGAGFSGDLESAPAAFGLAVGYGATERLTFEGELGLAPNGTTGVPIE